MRTDKELQEGVLKALDWEPSVNAAQIGVTVRRGVVTLTGQVGTLAEKWIAEKTARHVWGVRAIANDLVVAPDGASIRSDTSGAAKPTVLRSRRRRSRSPRVRDWARARPTAERSRPHRGRRRWRAPCRTG